MTAKFLNLDQNIGTVRPTGYKYPVGLTYVLLEEGYSNTFIDSTGGSKVVYNTGPGTQYGIHHFLSSSEFIPGFTGDVEYVVVAGGGCGGFGRPGGGAGGGGGGGGLKYGTGYPVVSGNPYTMTVGAGGTASGSPDINGSSGSPSSFGPGISTTGGGYGAYSYYSPGPGGAPGGSGGGAGAYGGSGGSGNAGEGYPTGTAGGNGYPGTGQPGDRGGGGGGAGGNSPGKNGGPSAPVVISPSYNDFAGGGGAGFDSEDNTAGQGGQNAGSGWPNSPPAPYAGRSGTANYGGGGGGGAYANPGGNGGSGIIIVRYVIQESGSNTYGYLVE